MTLRPVAPEVPPEAPPRDAKPRPVSARFQDGGCGTFPAVRVAVTTGSRRPGMGSGDGWWGRGRTERLGRLGGEAGAKAAEQPQRGAGRGGSVDRGRVGSQSKVGRTPEEVGVGRGCADSVGLQPLQSAGHTPPGEPAQVPLTGLPGPPRPSAR